MKWILWHLCFWSKNTIHYTYHRIVYLVSMSRKNDMIGMHGMNEMSAMPDISKRSYIIYCIWVDLMELVEWGGGRLSQINYLEWENNE